MLVSKRKDVTRPLGKQQVSRVRDVSFFGSDGDYAIGGSCGAVDGFDQREAAAALEAVTGGGAMLLDGLKKIFEDGLVAAEIGDGGGGGALVFVERCRFGAGGRDPEIGG